MSLLTQNPEYWITKLPEYQALSDTVKATLSKMPPHRVPSYTLFIERGNIGLTQLRWDMLAHFRDQVAAIRTGHLIEFDDGKIDISASAR